jgi:hypothetical protein
MHAGSWLPNVGRRGALGARWTRGTQRTGHTGHRSAIDTMTTTRPGRLSGGSGSVGVTESVDLGEVEVDSGCQPIAAETNAPNPVPAGASACTHRVVPNVDFGLGCYIEMMHGLGFSR